MIEKMSPVTYRVHHLEKAIKTIVHVERMVPYHQREADETESDSGESDDSDEDENDSDEEGRRVMETPVSRYVRADESYVPQVRERVVTAPTEVRSRRVTAGSSHVRFDIATIDRVTEPESTALSTSLVKKRTLLLSLC